MSPRERKATPAVVTWRTAVDSPLSGVSGNAKHVGLSLSKYMGEAGDSAFPSPATLSEDSSRAVSTVREALRELERSGWIVRVRQGGGRGNTNEWASTIPDSFWEFVEELVGRKTRRDTAAFRAAREVLRKRARDAQEPLRAAASAAATDTSPESETRRPPAPFAEGKPAGAATETCRRTEKNPPPSGTEVEDLEGSSKEQQQGADVVDAAAAALHRELRRHRIAADVRELALVDPERAQAWVDVAGREARENVGGFIATGIRGGEWPSARGGDITDERRHEGRVAALRAWVVDRGDPAFAHDLIEDWTTITQVERNEYHMLVDELVSEQLPDATVDDASRNVA